MSFCAFSEDHRSSRPVSFETVEHNRFAKSDFESNIERAMVIGGERNSETTLEEQFARFLENWFYRDLSHVTDIGPVSLVLRNVADTKYRHNNTRDDQRRMQIQEFTTNHMPFSTIIIYAQRTTQKPPQPHHHHLHFSQSSSARIEYKVTVSLIEVEKQESLVSSQKPTHKQVPYKKKSSISPQAPSPK